MEDVSRAEYEALVERVAQLENQLRRMSRIDGEGRALIIAQEVRTKKVTVLNDEMKTCITLVTNPDGGRIGIRHSNGQVVWVAGAAAEGGVVGLCDTRGKVGFKACGGPAGGRISLSNKRKKNAWSVP